MYFFKAVTRLKNRWPNPSSGVILSKTCMATEKACTFSSTKFSHSFVRSKTMFVCVSEATNLSAPTTSTADNFLRVVVEPPFSLKIFRNFASSGPSEPNNIQSSKTYFESAGRLTDGIAHFHGELEGFSNEVKALVSNRDRDGAVKLIQANYDLVKKRMDAGVKGLEEICFIGIIGSCYSLVGNKKAVEAIAVELEEILKGLSDEDLPVLPVPTSLESIFLILEKFKKSMRIFRRQINILEKAAEKNRVRLAILYMKLAISLDSTKKTTQAMDCYRRAISILESTEGLESGKLLFPLCNLGNLLFLEGKTNDAETHFLRFLKIHEKIYGKLDIRVTEVIFGLAKWKHAIGDAEKANHWCGIAIQVIRDSYYLATLDHDAVKVATELTELLYDVGREDECKEILQEAILAAEKIRGKEHPCVAERMVLLAHCYVRSKNFEEAEQLYSKSVEILSKTGMSDSQAVASPMTYLAASLFSLQRTEEADKAELEALRIYENEFGEESREYAMALEFLLSVQFKYPKDDGELLEKFRRLLRIQEKLGMNEEVMETLETMAVLLDKLGRMDEKLSVEERLSKLRM